MATITGLTADRMLAIEDASVVDGSIVDGDLVLVTHGGTLINTGQVAGAPGPQGPQGPPGSSTISAIPGEIKVWPHTVLPELASYGKWVWADGGVYTVATYPVAAGHIAPAWKTFGGASDPGAGNFRVPDFRGLIPAGMDQMPGGARANRMTRAVAITIAGKSGEEIHYISVAELPPHDHSFYDPGHTHTVTDPGHNHNITDPGHGHGVSDPGHSHGIPYGEDWENGQGGAGYGLTGSTLQSNGAGTGVSVQNGPTGISVQNKVAGISVASRSTGISIGNAGSGNATENVQPTVFVPYIVKLDD